ncbi:MAG: helix-turn-helix domain-containing protein [Tannerella sp.]|jgi:DNA-binding XRE family transcriptional regulator|nr:helix-turn-helix domain-containing protein [Tannerella sp.]
MKERIIQIMNAQGLSPAKFAEIIGVQRAAISHILNDRNKPSLEVARKILARFRDVNPDWLIMGEGVMKRNIHTNHAPKESGLFTNVSDIHISDIKTNESRANKPSSISSVLEKTFMAKNADRKIEQIMIFFSDNTFESFRPEKHE